MLTRSWLVMTLDCSWTALTADLPHVNIEQQYGALLQSNSVISEYVLTLDNSLRMYFPERPLASSMILKHLPLS